MPISGIIITLANPEHDLERVRALLSLEPRIDCGELQGNHLPAILDTATAHDSNVVYDWLLELAGVVNVDVVFVNWEDQLTPTEKP